ncbi:DUF4037 domain-containing protein [Pradoshia sp.]
MAEFIKGMELCRRFFLEAAKPIIDRDFPELEYSAGLIGYGSDVLGYDDPISRDHMWGPRFYMFLKKEKLQLKEKILDSFGKGLPYTFLGYSVNFSEPDMNDNGVQHPEFITEGKVRPLIFIMSFEEFLMEQLGTGEIENLSAADWLSFSEHRLLSIMKGEFFHDGLKLEMIKEKLRYYPDVVKTYLAGSCWESIAQEQAFVRRTFDVGDDMGSRIITARICERLMRLCFIYRDSYAPYSKWFGRAFQDLEIDKELRDSLETAIGTSDIHEREKSLIKAQLAVAELHNKSGMTEYVECRESSYFGRDIKVIYCDKISSACAEKLRETELEGVPLLGSMSQIGNLSVLSDEVVNYSRIKRLYE